jgi:hypothetical protein
VLLLVNYANRAYRQAQRRNSETGKEVALCDEVAAYGPSDIPADFYEKNRRILSQVRGNGYWLWKPFFMYQALSGLRDGDFMFYCDSGAHFLKPIRPLIDICRDESEVAVTFELKHTEKHWTKRDAFILMDCDAPAYTETFSRIAGYVLLRKSSTTMAFLREYLEYAQDERILTDLPNRCGEPNYSGFKEHRHDQSIFSLLAKRYDFPAHRDPSQWGNDQRADYPQSVYGQLIELTRARTVSVVRKVFSRYLQR